MPDIPSGFDAKRPVRAAIREEGAWVNVYFAFTHTMEGAKLVMSIRKDIVKTNPDIVDAVKKLAGLMVSSWVHDMGLEVKSVSEERPPEHERSGHD